MIDLEKFKGKSIFVATPMFGGTCFGSYTKSLLELNTLCSEVGIGLQYYFLFSESLISRARNYSVDAFLQSDCTHMLFIDADISFDPRNAVTLLYHSIVEEDKDVICAPYPKKSISWEKIKSAVDKGLADENPNNLENYVGDYVLNFAKHGSYNLGTPIEVSEAGTGFMLIRRETFEKFEIAYPQMKYKPDHLRNEGLDGSREITAFFMDEIDQETKRHLSEDYMFCKWLRKINCKVWICPWMNLNHTGMYTFKGNLVKVVSAGLSATMNKQS